LSRTTITTRGILFDMDGILISSLGSVERSWAKWGEIHGVDGATAIKTAHGQRAIETIRKLAPGLDENVELRLIEDLEIADNEGLTILPGVSRLLASLPQQYWTIVTSATERLAQHRLQYAGIPVPARILTADMVTHGKPHPEPYLKGAALLGLAPADCIVIEDAPAGAAAGHAAGCRVLATAFSHSTSDLKIADWIIASLEVVEVKILPDGEGVELRFEIISRV
jgi:sugar-phosphatase